MGFLSGAEVGDVMLAFDSWTADSVPCAKVLPGELRAGDVFRWSGRFASDPFTTQCVTVVEVSGEYDEQVFVIDQDGYVWMFDVDDVIEVISLSASLDGVS